VQLAPDSLAQVRAGAALQSTADLPALMDRLLQLLREGGELVLEVPARHGRWPRATPAGGATSTTTAGCPSPSSSGAAAG
jgi:trans-aconitate methyltransferase